MALPHSPIKSIKGLREIASLYDVILCDVWGVLHNGVSSWEDAYLALESIKREQGATVVLVTNAPRRNPQIREQLKVFGITPAAYDDIVTSGDVTTHLLQSQSNAKVFPIGPDRDLSFYDGIQVELVDAKSANLLSVTGLFEDEVETPEDYRAQFEQFLAKNIPMICANPDIIVERGTKQIYCGGALAQLYEEMGGSVSMVGKPYAPIYDRAMQLAEQHVKKSIDKTRVLAIGDAFRTDLKGAYDYNVDALMITGGIHSAEFGALENPQLQKVEKKLLEHSLKAKAFMPKLKW